MTSPIPDAAIEAGARFLCAEMSDDFREAALNQGIGHARSRHFDYVILFDQDSEPEQDMIATLRTSFVTLSEQGVTVAAVGPSYHDLRTGREAPFVRCGFPSPTLLYPRGNDLIPCDFLITSGVFISNAVLGQVGLMDDSLFIDCIDMDWCFRARARGYKCFGVSHARMGHRIGDKHISVRLFAWRLGFTVHGSLRLYYIMRNRILQYASPQTMRSWVLNDMMRIPVKIGLVLLFAPDRFRNAVFMATGLFHGLLGRRGPAPQWLTLKAPTRES